MTIQEILQEIKKIADNNSFVNFSYIGDVEEMKLQPGFEYPGFAVQNYSYDEETKTYYMSMYLISEDKTLEQACLNAIKDIVYNVNLKHLDLGIVIKSDNILIITTGKLNGAYCSMQLQMTLTSCVCEDKPGYVSSVNGQTGDVILDIPDIERTVIDVNGQTGHVVLDIPEKLSDLYQDIEYATPAFVDEKVTAEHNYTDSVKSNLEDEIGKLVTGVSSVNGSTGDVVIFIPKMTSDLENDSDFIDSEYVDNLIESLNSSINTNYAKKSELNTAISDEVSRADNAYAKKTDIPTNVYTKQEVDDKDKNIIANTSLNFATKTQLNTAISDEVSRADNKYANKTDIPTDFYTKKEVDDKISEKQDVLVSGTNIKTINGKDILGSGNIDIEAGTDEAKVKEIISSEMYAIYLPGIATSVENADKEIIANASINYLLKTDYIAPDVDKEYVDTEIGKLVTGVSSVNGMTGDVTIETADTKYVDDKFDTLNSSVNANFQVKGDYATNERVNNVEALIPTDVVEHAEIADFVTNSSITENYYKKSEVDNKIETLDSSVSEHYVKKGEVPQDVYSKEEVNTLFTEYDETVDSTYEKKGHYDNKISEIDSSISDVSSRLAEIKIPTDYVKTADYSADKEAQATKDSEQDSNIATANLNISLVDAKVEQVKETTTEQIGSLTGQINGVSDRVSTIELNYVNNKTFTDKTSEIDSSISDVSTRIEQLAGVTSLGIEAVSGRVSTIEGDYVKHDEIEHFVTDSSVSVNYATKSELDELKLFKFPNVTIIGEPTINNGQISDFSVNNYLEFPFLVNFRDRAFEINFDIKTGSNVTAQENILDSDYGLAFAVRNSRFVMAVSTNGTSWNLGEIIGSHEILPDTSYRVKISYDRLRYKVQYSTDGGQTYIDDATKTAANQSPFPKQMYIGVGEVNATVKNVFSGIINLNYANLLINGELVWQGMDDVGLATRLAVDMSNIDPAGEQKVKDIIATEGYIKVIPENDYATRDELNSSLANVSSWVNNNFARKSSLEGLITEADADKKYYGKTAGEGLDNYVHTKLDGEITDLYKKDQEIDSSISDVSSRLKTVKDTVDGLDNVYVKSETYNIDKNAQAEVNQDVTTKLGKINTSIGTLNSSVNAIENAGYLDADDKAELEGQINGKQDAGDYATNTRVNEVEGKIPEVKDFVTNSSISTNYYNKTEIDNKGYLNKVTADSYYQEKGNYVNETVYSKKVSEIDSSISDVSARLKTANDNIANKADLSELANYYTNSQGTALEGRVSSAELNITGLQGNIQTLDEKINTKADNSTVTTLSGKVDVLETTVGNKQDTLVSGTNIKTINGNNILGNGNIEIKAGIDFLTPETIVKIDKTNLEFIADLTTTSENKARSILINSGEQYYYELISGDGHTFYDAYGSEKQILWRSEVFTWDSNSFNTKDGYDNDDGNYNEIYDRSTNSVGKLYKYLGSIEEEKPLETYIKDTAEGGGEEHVSLTYEEWQNLPYDEQMTDKVYLIKDAENVYQTPLVSGTNIKTINNESILGSGNIEIKSGDSTGFTYENTDNGTITYAGKHAADIDGDSALIIDLPGDEKVSIHTNNIEINSNEYRNFVQFYGLNFEYYDSDNGLQGQIYYSNIATKTEVSEKQDTLVSGNNIKTINGNSILGEGNIVIQGGGGSGSEHQNITQAEYDALTPEQKQADIVYFITDADVVYATTAYVDEKIGDINTILESI